MATIIKNDEFTGIGKGIKPDSRMRVGLPRHVVKEGIIYHIYVNLLGQVLLDPQVIIPASEAWIFEDKAALASIDRGMAESASGQTIDRGSFAQYVEDVP